MPRDNQPFGYDNEPEQQQPKCGEHDDDREGDVHAQIPRRNLDLVAKTCVTTDPFGNRRSDGGVHRRTLQTDKQLRQGGRQADLEKTPKRPGARSSGEMGTLNVSE